jgi:hypothetical protein
MAKRRPDGQSASRVWRVRDLLRIHEVLDGENQPLTDAERISHRKILNWSEWVRKRRG